MENSEHFKTHIRTPYTSGAPYNTNWQSATGNGGITWTTTTTPVPAMYVAGTSLTPYLTNDIGSVTASGTGGKSE